MCSHIIHAAPHMRALDCCRKSGCRCFSFSGFFLLPLLSLQRRDLEAASAYGRALLGSNRALLGEVQALRTAASMKVFGRATPPAVAAAESTSAAGAGLRSAAGADSSHEVPQLASSCTLRRSRAVGKGSASHADAAAARSTAPASSASSAFGAGAALAEGREGRDAQTSAAPSELDSGAGGQADGPNDLSRATTLLALQSGRPLVPRPPLPGSAQQASFSSSSAAANAALLQLEQLGLPPGGAGDVSSMPTPLHVSAPYYAAAGDVRTFGAPDYRFSPTDGAAAAAVAAAASAAQQAQGASGPYSQAAQLQAQHLTASRSSHDASQWLLITPRDGDGNALPTGSSVETTVHRGHRGGEGLQHAFFAPGPGSGIAAAAASDALPQQQQHQHQQQRARRASNAGSVASIASAGSGSLDWSIGTTGAGGMGTLVQLPQSAAAAERSASAGAAVSSSAPDRGRRLSTEVDSLLRARAAQRERERGGATPSASARSLSPMPIAPEDRSPSPAARRNSMSGRRGSIGGRSARDSSPEPLASVRGVGSVLVAPSSASMNGPLTTLPVSVPPLALPLTGSTLMMAVNAGTAAAAAAAAASSGAALSAVSSSQQGSDRSRGRPGAQSSSVPVPSTAAAAALAGSLDEARQRRVARSSISSIGSAGSAGNGAAPAPGAYPTAPTQGVFLAPYSAQAPPSQQQLQYQQYQQHGQAQAHHGHQDALAGDGGRNGGIATASSRRRDGTPTPARRPSGATVTFAASPPSSTPPGPAGPGPLFATGGLGHVPGSALPARSLFSPPGPSSSSVSASYSYSVAPHHHAAAASALVGGGGFAGASSRLAGLAAQLEAERSRRVQVETAVAALRSEVHAQSHHVGRATHAGMAMPGALYEQFHDGPATTAAVPLPLPASYGAPAAFAGSGGVWPAGSGTGAGGRSAAETTFHSQPPMQLQYSYA